MTLVRAGLVLGLVIWAAATALFVPLGHLVFGPDNRLPVPISAGLIVVATFFGSLGSRSPSYVASMRPVSSEVRCSASSHAYPA